MREIKKSDNPLIYQILWYGNLGFPEQLKDSCQKNRALILGTIIIFLIPVVVSFILYWVGYGILGVPVVLYTGVFVDHLGFSLFCWTWFTTWWFMDKIWIYLFGSTENGKKQGKMSKLREEFKESYKSFKEKYCEEIKIINDKPFDK